MRRIARSWDNSWDNGAGDDPFGVEMALTVKEMEALTAADKGRNLSDGGSLKGKVYVARNGDVSVQFRFAYKLRSKSREVLVGTWPKTGLADIRKSRDSFRVQIRSGVDPVEQNQINRLNKETQLEVGRLKAEADSKQAIHDQRLRLQELAAKQARMTIRELFVQWRRLELSGRVDKGAEVERAFKRDVFDLIGDVAVADVTKAQIQQIVDTIKARATDTNRMVPMAKKTLADMRQMFGFALDRDYVVADPTGRIKKEKIGKDVERDRVLSESELIDLFRKLPMAALAETSVLALRLQLSTITRIGEVLGARWDNVDFERRLWRLPETKNGKAHQVWLSDFAWHQLESLKAITGLTPWLFPASRTKKNHPDFFGPVCPKTVTKQVGDRQRIGAAPMSKRTQHVDTLILLGGKWTPHDLRRTGATMMAELGAMPDVVEKCLNHTEENKVKRIYQRATYEAAMRDAWRQLGERLELLQDRANGNSDNLAKLKVA